MNGNKSAKLFLLALTTLFLSISSAVPQGFSGLGTKANGFAVPQKGYTFSFPNDHASHPEFRIEWWYITANMTGDDGKEYGLQWTLFRSAFAPREDIDRQVSGWRSNQLWMGHAAVTSSEHHHVAETIARGGIGTSGVIAHPFEAWINDWSMQSQSKNGHDPLSHLRLKATGSEFAYNVDLKANGPLVFHGDAGYSTKSPEGQASYYYSHPFYEMEGTLQLPGGDVKVSGNAWLDREWSSQPLSEKQDGWDWVSLTFDDGSKLMGFSLRQSDGTPYTSATWIDPNGKTTPYGNGTIELLPLDTTLVEGRSVPTRWRVKLKDRALDVVVKALNDQAWMKTSIPYWEGPVLISGSHKGRGYLEMTGY